MKCSICIWVCTGTADVRDAITIINGHAVCHKHAEAASLAADHRHAAVLAGAKL